MTGRKFGNYEILDKLGEGGMGEVWRARDARLSRSVALKVLPSDVAADPLRRQRFEQEARALGALNHPNIVSVYDVGQSEGQAYIVSELVTGESLRSILDRGPLSSRKLVEYGIQIAEAMAAAHTLGIIHRDLKPENVMVTRDDRVKVLDFGLAKQSAPAPDENTATMVLSQAGMVVGTVGYMSPEQVRGRAVDVRSDIFSFGCVLYEMATGQKAFGGNSAADVMSSILKDEPVEISTDRIPVSPALDAIIRRCLEKDPARRFQSAADLAFALRSLSTLSTSQPAVAAPMRRTPRKWGLAAAALAACAALFAAGYLVRAGTATTPMPKYQRLTFREGRVSAARFSPDWKDVIYSANWDGGESRVYLATPGNPESRDLQLPDTRLLSVSSKGDLAVLTGPFFPDGSGTLGRTALGGGQTRPLLERIRWAEWSPDASEMAIVRMVNNKGQLEYPVGKPLLQTEWGPFAIRISPDGRQVAFTTYDYGTSIGLYVAERGGKPRKIAVISGQTSDPGASPLCWTHDGKEIVFRAFDNNEANTIYAIDLSGSRRVVARFPGRVMLHDVAADGRILFTTGSVRMGIRGVEPGETTDRDLSVLETSSLVAISDDGREILADASGESGGAKGSIYIRRTDGSAPLRLGDGVAFYLSPDAKWVSGYTTRGNDPRKFILLPTGAGDIVDINVPQLAGGKGVIVGWLNGERNYLVGGAYPGKQWQYFAWGASAGTLRPVTPEGVPDTFPLVAPDRKRFLAQCADRRPCIFPVDGGEPKLLVGLSPHDKAAGWRADGRAIYFMTHHDQNNMMPISLLDIQTATRTPWKEIRPSIPVDQITNARITPDGKAYAYNYGYERSELYVAEGVK
jgi:Tol biopolymer transport system component